MAAYLLVDYRPAKSFFEKLQLLANAGGSDRKESACNTGDLGSIPGSGRSLGEGNGNPLQCSCLDNPMDRGARQFSQEGHKESDTTQATQQQQLVYVNPNILIYQPHYLPALSLFHLLCVISPPLKKGSGQTKLPWWIRC